MRRSRSPWHAVVLPICLLVPTVALSRQPTIEPLEFHTAPPLKLKPIGKTSVKAWYRALEIWGSALPTSPRESCASRNRPTGDPRHAAGGRWQAAPVTTEDGQIWGSLPYGNYSVIFTIDPKTLATKPLGRTEDERHIDLWFHQGSLYLSGFPTVMKVTGLRLP